MMVTPTELTPTRTRLSVALAVGALVGANIIASPYLSAQPAAGGAIGGTEAAIYREIAVDLTTEALRLLEVHGATRVPAGDAGGALTDVASEDDSLRSAALQLLLRARSIDPGLGDPAILLADLLVHDQSATHTVIGLLESALESDLFSYRRIDVATRLAAIYLRIGRPAAARELLTDEAVRAGGGDPYRAMIAFLDSDDPGVRSPDGDAGAVTSVDLLFARSLLASGEPWIAADWVERVRAVQPEDAQVAALAWERAPRVSLAMVESLGASMGAGATRAELEDAILRSVNRWRGAADSGGSMAAHAIGMWRVLGGSGGAVAAALGEPALVEQDKLTLELLADRNAVISEIVPTDASALTLDANRDGFIEETYHLEDGHLGAWLQDGDSDGVTDLAVVSDEHTTLFVRDGSTVYALIYAALPLLSEAWRIVLAVDDGPVGGEVIAEGVRVRFSQPRPLDPHLRLVGTDGRIDPWPRIGRLPVADIASARVAFDSDAVERVRRQFSSSVAVRLDGPELDAIDSRLRQWGLILSSALR